MKKDEPTYPVYYFKHYKGKKLVKVFWTRSINRFSYWGHVPGELQPGEKIYIKVDYGPKLGIHTHTVHFTNSGTYTTRRELLKAYEAFIQEE